MCSSSRFNSFHVSKSHTEDLQSCLGLWRKTLQPGHLVKFALADVGPNFTGSNLPCGYFIEPETKELKSKVFAVDQVAMILHVQCLPPAELLLQHVSEYKMFKVLIDEHVWYVHSANLVPVGHNSFFKDGVK